MSTDLLEGTEVVNSFCRRQAIEAGALVQLAGPGHEGEPWMPQMVARAGIKCQVAMTVEAFVETVLPPRVNGHGPVAGHDVQDRLWAVLSMFRCAIALQKKPTRVFLFALHVVPNSPDMLRNGRLQMTKLVYLKAVCGYDDEGSPCITITYPHQD